MLLLVLAAVLIALTTAALYALGSRSPVPSASDGSVLTASGSTSFANGGEMVGDPRYGVGGAITAAARRGPFKVALGTVSGLYPGKKQRLRVTFSNPLAYPIRIGTATPTATSPSGCPIDTSLRLRTRTFTHLVIRPNKSERKSLRFGMLKSATDACQNATFTITVSVTAVRA